jgi:LacI family transcriptional regulator
MMSIKDIATKARVSVGTVDRVLHNRGRVSEKTRVRVQKIISDLGYRPNIYARNLSLGKEFRFGVLMPRLSQDNGYWSVPAKGIDRAGRELQPHKVGVEYFHFDRYSERSFEQWFQRALKQELDGMLIAPVLTRAAEKLISTIPQNLPYVFFDSTVPSAKCLSFIGQDPFQSGLLAAHLMKNLIRQQGSVAIIKVVPGDFHINERIRGFQSGLNGNSRVTPRIYEADSHGGENAFRRTSAAILSDNKDLRGIFVTNAWTHPFARHLKSAPGREDTFVIGYDLVGKNREYLEAGLIDLLISQRPAMQGYEGIYCLYERVVLREDVEVKIMVPIDILTKDNLTYYRD